MPLSEERALEIVEAYKRIKEEHPDWPDQAIALQIPRRDGKKGITPHTLTVAKSLVGGARARDIADVVRSLTSQVPKGRSVLDVVGVPDAAVAFSDMHFNDVDCLHESFFSALDRAVERVRSLGFGHILFIVDGDLVSGTGIFRGQAISNVVNAPHHQAIVGAWALLTISQRFQEAGIQADFIYIRGNHDVSKESGGDLGWWVTTEAQKLGLEISYYPLEAVIFFAPGVSMLVVHGFGYSRFRPQSPAFQDHSIRRLQELNARRPPEEQVQHILHGHQHWLDLGFSMGNHSITFHSLGGFQRYTRRIKAFRPIGGALFYVRGGDLAWEEIRPDPDILEQELEDPLLSARNVGRVGEWLYKGAKELGYG